MYTLDDLNYLVHNFPKHIMGCMLAQDIICASLENKWTPEIFKRAHLLDPIDYRGPPFNGTHFINISSQTIQRQYSDPHSKKGLSMYNGNTSLNDIISFIQDNLNKYDVVSIDIGVSSDTFNYDYPQHSFVLINIDQTIYIVDAYAKFRRCEYRKFDMDRFFKLLNHPNNIILWNEIFKANETTNDSYNKISLAIRF
jgi:hypothetical protein